MCSGAGSEGQRSQQRASLVMRFRPPLSGGQGGCLREEGDGALRDVGGGDTGKTMEGRGRSEPGGSTQVPAVLGCLSPEVWATLRCLAAG